MKLCNKPGCCIHYKGPISQHSSSKSTCAQQFNHAAFLWLLDKAKRGRARSTNNALANQGKHHILTHHVLLVHGHHNLTHARAILVGCTCARVHYLSVLWTTGTFTVWAVEVTNASAASEQPTTHACITYTYTYSITYKVYIVIHLKERIYFLSI